MYCKAFGQQKTMLRIVFLYNYVYTYMYCPKLVTHSNQIKPPMASSLDYIISQMSQSLWKVLSLGTGTPGYTKYQNFHVSLSHHLPSVGKDNSNYRLQNSIPLCYVNKVMTDSIGPMWDTMLMLF